MVKLQDFAKECGVTDRAIQKHLVKYADELEGLYQRRGPNGTWLTEEACEILRSKMKQLPMAISEPDPRVGQLEFELAEMKAAAKDMWELSKQKDKTIASLVEQNQQLQLKEASVARLEADNKLARVKTAEAEKAAQEAQHKLIQAHAAFEKDIQKKNERILAWEQYALEVAAYNELPWIKRIGKKAPIAPEALMIEYTDPR